MAGQYGRAAQPNGQAGTEPETLQALIAGRYTNSHKSPVLRCGKVTGRADRAYGYPAGEGVLSLGANRAIEVAWDAGVTALVATPAQARVDTIYVFEDAGVVGVRVAQGVAPPAGSVVIGRRSLPAGATATSASTDVDNRYWAMPYGATIAWLATHGEVHAHGSDVPKQSTTVTSLPFWAPTDRAVRIVVQQAIFGATSVSDPADARSLGMGSMRYRLTLDGSHLADMELAYTKWWARATDDLYLLFPPVAEGSHVLRVDRRHTTGADPKHFGGGGDRMVNGFVGIMDLGAAE